MAVSFRRMHRAVTMHPVEIGSSQRVFVTGQSGSGKSTLSLDLVTPYEQYTIIDPKQEIMLPDIPIVNRFNPSIPRQIVRSSVLGKGERDAYDAICEDIFAARRPGIIYIDEVTVLTTAQYMPQGLGKLVRLGRSLGMGVWCASQRPMGVATALLTEANHFFIFRLTNPADVKRIASFTDPRVLKYIPKENYESLYYNVNDHRLLRIPPN